MNPTHVLTRQIPGPILPSPTMNNNSGSGVMLGGGQLPVTTPAPASTAAPSAGGVIIQSTGTMANMKEKTPMCLVNELARFNKVQHQYRLVEESGPPHKKTFTVILKLDTEEYTASGPSIKKAQHAAAASALEQTQLKHPPPKSQRKALGPITPTVELNALAMKRGEPAVYQLIEPSRPQYIPNLNFRGMYQQRYHYPKIPTYYVSLKVGCKQFFGEGRTAQAARHAAAEEALGAFRSIPFSETVAKRPPNDANAMAPNGESGGATNGDGEEDDGDDEGDDLKSPISLVHEIALKRGLGVNFEVTREAGPPHMRTFVTCCVVGETRTEGEGNGKKVSKKRAAEKMLDELKKLPAMPPPPAQQKFKKKPIIKKKNRNLIKVMPDTEQQKTNTENAAAGGINPISRLIQIQQAKKEREPVYTVVDERGEPRQREFIMQCSLGDLVTNGSGPNKKTAKRNAAESMLQRMGYSRPIAPPVSTTGVEGAQLYQTQDIDKGKMYPNHDGVKLDTEGKMGRQLVPGLLLMPDSALSDQTNHQNYSMGNSVMHRAPGCPPISVNKMYQTVAIIAKELLDTGLSPTAEAIRQASHKPMTHQPLRGFKQRLLYLADVMGFPVNFTDFPKSAAKMEHICLVSVPISPNQVKHGAGATIEAAHDQAALGALRSLAELDPDKNIPGDGLYMSGQQGPPAPKLTNTSTDLGSNNKPLTAKDSH